MDNGMNGIQAREATYRDPTFLTVNGSKDKRKDSLPITAVIVLNQPIESKIQLLNLCSGAFWKIYADGGANRVFDLRRTKEYDRILYPDIICGDLDSLGPDAEEWFRDEGTAIVVDANQYKTDLQKSLKSLRELAQERDEVPIGYAESELSAVIIGGIGGRFDQGLSQLHHLFQENVEEDYSFEGRIYLINPESVCFLLDKGLNYIRTPVGPGLFRQSVGIVPIGRPSIVRTTGLEWDLTGEVTEFGGLMSTSNHIKRDWLEIDTSERVLLTIELDPPKSDSRVGLTSLEEIQDEMDKAEGVTYLSEDDDEHEESR